MGKFTMSVKRLVQEVKEEGVPCEKRGVGVGVMCLVVWGKSCGGTMWGATCGGGGALCGGHHVGHHVGLPYVIDTLCLRPFMTNVIVNVACTMVDCHI